MNYESMNGFINEYSNLCSKYNLQLKYNPECNESSLVYFNNEFVNPIKNYSPNKNEIKKIIDDARQKIRHCINQQIYPGYGDLEILINELENLMQWASEKNILK